MIFLTSTGITNNRVFDIAKEKYSKRIEKVCIIAAGLPTKRQHPIAKNCEEFFKNKNVGKISFIDIECEDVQNIKQYDLLLILGGNFVKLNSCIKKFGVDDIIKDMVKNNKIIIGASAGAFVLSSGNILSKEFNSIEGMPNEKVDDENDLIGLNFTNHILFPHYDIFNKTVKKLEEKLKLIEKNKNINITRLNNMDYIYIDEKGNSVMNY